MAAPSSSRFANLDDEEYELLLQDKDTVNTKKSTKTAVIIFRDYLSDKGQNIDFHVLRLRLRVNLRRFFKQSMKVSDL